MDALSLLSAARLAAYSHLPCSVRRIAMASPSRFRPWMAACTPVIPTRKGSFPPGAVRRIMTGTCPTVHSEEIHPSYEAVQGPGQAQLLHILNSSTSHRRLEALCPRIFRSGHLGLMLASILSSVWSRNPALIAQTCQQLFLPRS